MPYPTHLLCNIPQISLITGGVLLYTEGNLEMYNEDGTAQEPAFGSGVPGQSWLARATFGTANRVFLLSYVLY